MANFESEEIEKLQALHAAARAGCDAIDRGQFMEFESVEDLQAYLDDLADRVIAGIAER